MVQELQKMQILSRLQKIQMMTVRRRVKRMMKQMAQQLMQHLM